MSELEFRKVLQTLKHQSDAFYATKQVVEEEATKKDKGNTSKDLTQSEYLIAFSDKYLAVMLYRRRTGTPLKDSLEFINGILGEK